jgi:HK97 family phage portal protein
LNVLTKVNLLAWYAGQRVKGGINKVFNLSLSNPKAWNSTLWNLAGSQSVSGEVVTEETALTYSAVWNAVTLISGTTASLPLHLMITDGRSKRRAVEQSVYPVLQTRYNPYMSAMAGRECLASHALTWGNGYAEIVYDEVGNIVELWPIPPNRCTPQMSDGKLVYEITIPNSGEQIILPWERVLHIPGFGFDGFVGYSPIAMSRKSIALGMAMETFGSLYFGQGTHPGVVVKHPGKMDPSAHANLKQSLSDVYSGLGQSHRLMLLEDGMDMEKVGIPPEDSQFIESRAFQIPEICRWYNLPPHKLKDLTKSSFNNIEAEQSSFVTDSILPWLIRFEQNYQMQLLTKRQVKQGFYFKHVIEGLLRANAKDRAEFYKIMLNNGVFSINEVREKEDMNPVEGGDIHLVPMNMMSLEYAGEAPKQNAEVIPNESGVPGEDVGDKKVLKLIEPIIIKRSKAREPTRFQGGQTNENSE